MISPIEINGSKPWNREGAKDAKKILSWTSSKVPSAFLHPMFRERKKSLGSDTGPHRPGT
jgi:hypothetical protein